MRSPKSTRVAPTPSTEQPRFLYDDCCPLCRGYTATFTGLGWAGRQGFSTVDASVVSALDFDLARHKIPLYDPVTGNVEYGLDGILGVFNARVPVLAPVTRVRPVRRSLDALYWFITYNRRHIVSAAPPAPGKVDCAPDDNPLAVAAYLGFATVAGVGLAAMSGTGVAVAGAGAAGAALVAQRRGAWGIGGRQAAGHVGSVVVAAAGAGALTAAVAGSVAAANLAAVGVGARKIWLRRWMLAERHGATDHQDD
ncbi:MAG: hypothetical protein R2733_06850 [Acidimicrobiales bacterium]